MPVTRSAKINLEPVAKQVSDVLRQWILSGQLDAGEHIRQEAIAEELGVSRVPVREALLTLETEGLITRQKYKGAFVAQFSPEEVREVYLLRTLLECHLFEHALPNISESDLRLAEDIIDQSMRSESPEDWMRLNMDFHMALYEPSRLTLTLQTLKSLLLRTERYFLLQHAISPSIQQTSSSEHREIIRVIRSGDRDTALKTLRGHIEVNAEEVIDLLKQRGEPNPPPAMSSRRLEA